MWMFCSRSLNISLNHIHECALRLIYDDHMHSFQGMLEMTKEKTIHQKKLKFLGKEICKFLHGLSPPIIDDILKVRGNIYNLRNFKSLCSTSEKTVKFGTKRLRTEILRSGT